MVLDGKTILLPMERSTTSLTGKPGGHQLRADVLVGHQRRRILDATAALVAESGYRSLSVGAILKRGSVSKLKFYELYGSKADAFLAALDEAIGMVAEGVGSACAEAGDTLPERVDAGIGAALTLCVEHPELTRAAVLEAPALGPVAAGRREAAMAAFAPLLDGKVPKPRSARPPDGWQDGVLDGLFWILYEAILSGTPKRLDKLRPAMVEFALLPVLGPTASG